jgi:hypothetical protein
VKYTIFLMSSTQSLFLFCENLAAPEENLSRELEVVEIGGIVKPITEQPLSELVQPPVLCGYGSRVWLHSIVPFLV